MRINDDTANVEQRAAMLRVAFDESFTNPIATRAEPSESFLAVGAGSDAYALRLSGIAGLFTNKKVTLLPSTVTEFIGIGKFRGVLVPVYDLRGLLGYPIGSSSRWLVSILSEQPVCLAFDRFEGYFDAPRSAIAPASPGLGKRGYVHDVVQTSSGARSIIDLPSILDTIKTKAGYGNK